MEILALRIIDPAWRNERKHIAPPIIATAQSSDCALHYSALADCTIRKRCELPRPPRGYDRVLKRVGIQY